MSNPYFQFKQFTIQHDRCAMKVGTDGVLLGAWADVNKKKRALDVGSGSGLISLMLAQRNRFLHIDAVEFDKSAAEQAGENVLNSPFLTQVSVYYADFLRFAAGSASKYDLIVSNPPFFTDSLRSPSLQRTKARHNDSLQPEVLIATSASLLSTDGTLSLIYPTECLKKVEKIATSHNLFTTRICEVRPKWGMSVKRVLIELSPREEECVYTVLTIETERHVYTPEFKLLTKDFYLDRNTD